MDLSDKLYRINGLIFSNPCLVEYVSLLNVIIKLVKLFLRIAACKELERFRFHLNSPCLQVAYCFISNKMAKID